MENLDKLVNELRKLPNETQWLEFKHNNYDPVMIGQDISALANSAAMCEKSCAYMLWGIDGYAVFKVQTHFQKQKQVKENNPFTCLLTCKPKIATHLKIFLVCKFFLTNLGFWYMIFVVSRC